MRRLYMSFTANWVAALVTRSSGDEDGRLSPGRECLQGEHSETVWRTIDFDNPALS